MAELKTKINENSVQQYLENISDVVKKNDCLTLLVMMKEITKEEPKMWGDSIVGFGKYHYKYESGREGDWFITGFSSRKNNITIYIMSGFAGYEELMNKLGKHKTGQSCLYIKNLKEIDNIVLKELIKKSAEEVARRYN